MNFTTKTFNDSRTTAQKYLLPTYVDGYQLYRSTYNMEPVQCRHLGDHHKCPHYRGVLFSRVAPIWHSCVCVCVCV